MTHARVTEICRTVRDELLADEARELGAGFPRHWPREEWPSAINCGWCGLFAEVVVERCVEAGILDAFECDSADRLAQEIRVRRGVTFGGRHYDAEALEGVDDWPELPCFDRWKTQIVRVRTPEEERRGDEIAASMFRDIRSALAASSGPICDAIRAKWKAEEAKP